MKIFETQDFLKVKMKSLEIARLQDFCTKHPRASAAIAPPSAMCATRNASRLTPLWKFLRVD